MKDTRSIEQQVAELTEEQKSTVVKVGIIATAIIIAATLPAIIFLFCGVFALFNTSLSIGAAQGLVNTNFIIAGCCIAFLIAALVFVKVKFPYYSDARWMYIVKSRKKK